MFCHDLIFLEIEESQFWIEILTNVRIRHFDMPQYANDNSKEKRTIQLPHVGACD